MSGEKVGIGIIGCGNISGIYLSNARRFPMLDLRACADLDMDRARARASEYSVPNAYSVDELLADPDIQIVVNLTVPAAHADVAMQAVGAGKSVYNEKPLSISLDDGKRLAAAAAEKGLRVGCAPDTFLGAGLQTCRELIDGGAIGEVVAGSAFFLAHGPESWHPDPEFFYKRGAGPLFDMGPYYLTALISLLGPVRRVTGSARASFAEREIGSEPKRGQKIAVEVPTHSAAVLDFANGPIVTLVTSFDVWARTNSIELHGATGSLQLPDPNTFGGPVAKRMAGETDWVDVPVTREFPDNSRGLGVADMAMGILEGRPHRASGELALHVLEIMHAIHGASDTGRHIELTTTVQRPDAFNGV